MVRCEIDGKTECTQGCTEAGGCLHQSTKGKLMHLRSGHLPLPADTTKDVIVVWAFIAL